MLQTFRASLILLAAACGPVAAGATCPAALGLGCPAYQDPFEPELGHLGIQPPLVTDVLLADAMPHQDKVGGNAQQLTALCGAPGGGFAAVWRDQRDGSLGLYMVRLGADGAPLEPERSACQPHTMRRVDPAIVLGPDGSGAVTWTSVIGAGQTPWVRCFRADGGFQGEERVATPITDPDKVPTGRARTDNDVNCRLPSIARLANGRFAIAWTRGGHVQLGEVDASGAIVVVATDVKGTADVEPGVLLATGADGALACVWETKKNSASVGMAALRRENAFSIQQLGEGAPQGFERDPAGGFWVLVAKDGRSVLRHLGRDVKPDRADVVLEGTPVLAHQIAVFDGGIAVLQELGSPRAGDPAGPAKGKPARGERAQRARPTPETTEGVKLTLCDATGQPRPGAPFEVFSADAKSPAGPRIASNGKSLLVAWTDQRRGDTDVFGRLIDPAATPETRLGPERRFNTDEASSDQVGGNVAASGDRAIVAWVDKREVPAHIYARRFGAEGFAGDEFALPLAIQGETLPVLEGGVVRPQAGMRPNGDALVCWKHQTGRGAGRIVGQIVGLEGARTGLFEIDSGKDGEPLDQAVATLPQERGWFVVWSRATGGVWARRVGADGKPAGNPKRITEPNEWGEADADVAVLDDGRLICAWTTVPEGKPWSVRGRVVDDGADPRGEEIAFEHTRRGEDWDPSLAPADNNGFVMSWTAGGKQDFVRDAVVRIFDAQGHPKSPLATVCYGANEQDFSDVVRLPDKSFAIAWEDDISYNDQVYVRRLARDGRSMGTLMQLNGTETTLIPDRVAPCIAVLGNGIAAAFGDRHRSLGFDVTVKVVGKRFDDAPPPPREGDKKR